MAETELLPASMAQASAGMGGYAPRSIAMDAYYRYYPVAGTVHRMEQAVAAAESNPYVSRANALTAELNRMRTEHDERLALLQKTQAAQLQAQARIDAARLKAAGAAGRGRGGIRFDDLRKAIESYGKMGEAEGKLYEGRLKESSVGDRLNQLSTYGKMGAQSRAVQSAIGQMVNAAADKSKTGFDPGLLMEALAADTEAKGAVAALANNPDAMVERGSAARAMASALEARGIPNAAQVAANVFGVNAAMATAEGEADAVGRLAVQAQQVLEAGRGEAGVLPDAEVRMLQLIEAGMGMLGTGGGGDGGRGLAAEQARQAGRQLDPQEQAALDLDLQALRGDGLVTPGEMVGVAGEPRRPIEEAEIAAGKAAWEKARKHRSYRPEDAQWFDDEYLAQQRQIATDGKAERAAREKAIGRANRTAEEVRQDMAEAFVRSSVAARDLEVYVPPEQVNSPFEAQALGGALHILRREGDAVLDLDANPDSRSRRLGGTGPLAKTPLRVALKTFQGLPTDENGVPLADQMPQAIAQLRKRFKRDPDKMMTAVQYLMAMDMQAQQKAKNPAGGGKVPDAEAAPPPVADPNPEPASSIGEGNSVPDTAAWGAPTPPPRATPSAPSEPAVDASVLADILGQAAGTTMPRYGTSSTEPGEPPVPLYGESPLPPGETPYSLAEAGVDLANAPSRRGTYNPMRLLGEVRPGQDPLNMLGASGGESALPMPLVDQQRAGGPQPAGAHQGSRQPAMVRSNSGMGEQAHGRAMQGDPAIMGWSDFQAPAGTALNLGGTRAPSRPQYGQEAGTGAVATPAAALHLLQVPGVAGLSGLNPRYPADYGDQYSVQGAGVYGRDMARLRNALGLEAIAHILQSTQPPLE